MWPWSWQGPIGTDSVQAEGQPVVLPVWSKGGQAQCGQGWGTAPARAGHTRGQAAGAGFCGAEWSSAAQLCPSVELPKVPLAATPSPTWTDILMCKMQTILWLTPKPDGSSIFSCFLKEVGLRQSHCLLSCLLDVPLQQTLGLLAKFNHRRARGWKIKATSECHTNLHMGCGRDTTVVSPAQEDLCESSTALGFVSGQGAAEPRASPGTPCVLGGHRESPHFLK